MKVSASICTRKRSMLLEKAIKSLLNQTLAKDNCGILVVDNGAADRKAYFLLYDYLVQGIHVNNSLIIDLRL